MGTSTCCDTGTPPLRAGIIGLDTSHSTAFTRALNADEKSPELTGCRVVDKSSRNTTVYRLEFWFRTRGVDEKLKQRLNACLQLNAPTKRGLVWEYREHSKHISSTLPGR